MEQPTRKHQRFPVVSPAPRSTLAESTSSAPFEGVSFHWSIPWLGYLLTWGVIPHILLRNKPPVSTLAWIWAVILFPYVGPLFYFVFGSERIERQKLRASQEMAASGTRSVHKISAHTAALTAALSGPERAAVELLSNINNVAISSAESTRLLVGGKVFFPALAQRIDEAHDHVHLEFFIWRDDVRGRELRDGLRDLWLHPGAGVLLQAERQAHVPQRRRGRLLRQLKSQ